MNEQRREKIRDALKVLVDVTSNYNSTRFSRLKGSVEELRNKFEFALTGDYNDNLRAKQTEERERRESREARIKSQKAWSPPSWSKWGGNQMNDTLRIWIEVAEDLRKARTKIYPASAADNWRYRLKYNKKRKEKIRGKK